MFRNSIKLPLVALIFAAVGALVLGWDLNLRQQAEMATLQAADKWPTAGTQPLQVDGVIVKGEYANALQPPQLDMELFWTIRGDRLYVGLRAPTQGWVAIAFNPEGPLMKGADIVIGFVKEGQLYLQDNYADTPASHQGDEKLGGRDDLLEEAGSEDDTGTTIEFSRALDTKDSYDKPIRPGESMTLLLAYATADDFTSYHSKTRALVSNVDLFGGGP